MADYVVRFLGDGSNLEGTLKDIKGELNSTGLASSKLEEVSKKFERIQNSSKPLKKQLREVQALMSELNYNNLSDTEVFTKMAALAGTLKDAISDASTATRLLSSDTAGLDAMIQGFLGIAGVVGVATGVMGVFGSTNDDVARAIQRVQSVMAIMQGVLSVANVLNKDSIVVLKLKQVWQNAVTSATTKNTATTTANTAATTANTIAGTLNTSMTKKDTIATNAWNVAKAVSKALVGDFTGLLLVGAAALTSYALSTSNSVDELDKHSDASDKAKNSTDNLNSSVNKSAGEMLGKYKALLALWIACGDSLDKQRAFVNKNAEAMKALGLYSQNLNDVQNYFVKNTNNVVAAIIKRAKAMGALQYIEKASALYYSQLSELENARDSGRHRNWKVGDIVGNDKLKEFGLGPISTPLYFTKNLISGAPTNYLNEAGAAFLNGREILKSSREYTERINKLNLNFSKEVKRASKYLEGVDIPDSDSYIPKQSEATSKTYKNNPNRTPKTNKTPLWADDNQTEWEKYKEKLTKQRLELNRKKDNLEYLINTDSDLDKSKLLAELDKTTNKINIIDIEIKYKVKIDSDSVLLEVLKKNKELEQGILESGLNLLNTINKMSNVGEVDNSAIAEQMGLRFAELQKRMGDNIIALNEEQLEYFRNTDNSWTKSIGLMFEGDTTEDKLNGIAAGFEAVAGVLSNFDGGAAKAALVLASIGQLVYGYTAALKDAAKYGIIAWIGFAASGLATLVSTVTTIKKMADGGIVGGNSFHGDNILTRLNAGEMVLNQQQLSNLFKILNNGIATNTASGKVEFEIKGSTLKGVLRNYDNKMSRVQ